MPKKPGKRSCDLAKWQRRLAKLSFVLVFVLLLESYKDLLSSNYFNRMVAPKHNESGSRSIHDDKLNNIIKNLELLQKMEHFSDLKVPGTSVSPNFALENAKLVAKHPKLLHALSAIPCEIGMEPETNWDELVRPRFALNPERFLYPILKNQPIDQLIGLRQAILLAIKLNRTLVMPYFHNHNYGGTSQYNPAQHPELKVNVDVLRRFISVISVEEMQEKCKGKFDVALQTGHIEVSPGPSSLLKAQSELQMKMLNTMNTSVMSDFRVKYKIPQFPRKIKSKTKLSIIPRNVHTIYPKETSRYRCAVHPFPLSLFDVQLFLRKAMKLPNHRINIFKLKDEVLYSAIWYYTQPPIYVHKLASEFMGNTMKVQQIEGVNNFMCLNYHKHAVSQDQEIYMKTLRNILDLIIEKVGEIDSPLRLTAIYISSPHSKQDQTNLYQKNLKIFDGNIEVPVYSGHDVINSWKKNFHGERNSHESMCSLLQDDTQDVLSLVEMQICTEAAVFVRSIASSWAANVQVNRPKTVYSALDASIKDLLEQHPNVDMNS